MEKILLLTDFSDAAKKAIRFAQALFAETAADFYFLHAYPVEPDTMYGTGFLMEEAERMAYRSLQELLSEVVAAFHPPFHAYHIRTAPGSPIGAVETALEETDYEYVVVGASGSGLTPLLGSVATGLIRNARTNVLVVPQTVEIRPVREVVLATDYHTLEEPNCLRPLAQLIAQKEARLTGLSIVDNQTPILIGEEFEQYTQRFTDFFGRDDISFYFVLDQEVESGVNTYLDTHAVDLLVTIPHRKTLRDVIWNRSLTRRLAFRPRVPLLALYAPQPVG